VKRFILSTGFIAAAVLLSSALDARGQTPDKKSDQFRKEFLDKFQRTSLNTTPGDAMMLRILVESSRAKRGIEIGAASGFGAINMGIAFERNGGHLTSMEIDPRRAQETRTNLEKVGLEKTVTVLEGDALKLLSEVTGEVDFIFIDANKRDYLNYFKAIESKLKKGSVIVADNVIVSEKAVANYMEYVQGPNYDTVIIRSSMEKGDGMAISYKIR
jgi:predicted O-methyltransferase YrrM